MALTQTCIYVKLVVEGIHYWADVPHDMRQVSYLSQPHRHLFHIKCKKYVNHSDRDVEFIMFKHDIQKYLADKYDSGRYGCLNFDGRSCEMIANELLEKFDCFMVDVSEDDENGAEVYRI